MTHPCLRCRMPLGIAPVAPAAALGTLAAPTPVTSVVPATAPVPAVRTAHLHRSFPAKRGGARHGLA